MLTYASTTISVGREVPGAEKWETTLTMVGSDIRAHIQPTIGIGSLVTSATGTTSEATHLLLADVCDLRVGDVVTDGLGRVYDVDSAFLQQGPLEHVVARVVQRSIG